MKKMLFMRKIAVLCFWAGILLLFSGFTMMSLDKVNVLWLAAGAAALVLYVVINRIFWRCPECGKALNPSFARKDSDACCLHCGWKMQEK